MGVYRYAEAVLLDVFDNKMRYLTNWLQLSVVPLATSQLLGIPTVPFEVGNSGYKFSIKEISSVVVDGKYANATDTNGYTLIPPTLEQFATTFAEDLSAYTTDKVEVQIGDSAPTGSIFLTLGNAGDYLDAAGRPTSEGYTLSVSEKDVTITGASPLGVWWGTRTVLQQVVLGDGQLGAGSGVDSPGWGSRGIMLDAARHFYPADFLIEMCSYISFFKQNTFHVHLSDNLYNNVNIYDREQQLSLYATFRLLSDDPAVEGLNRRANESYTRSQFDEIQEKCAARGVTIIPEIEAPGHALVISQWKPEIGLQNTLDLLNISYADTIPTMQTIWKTFLPWFHTKVVHIGADEYRDPAQSKDALVAEYTRFVNALDTYIRSISAKTIRIWGTFVPTPSISPSTTIAIQHWANFEARPYESFLRRNFSVLNSDDTTYIVGKYSESYPQILNISRIFSGAPGGAPIAPNVFSLTDPSQNPPREHPGLLGHVAAQWNDYGPNATTVLEAFWAWRDGLAGLADKQWGGMLSLEEYGRVWSRLNEAAPGQNLERRVVSKGATVLKYDLGGGIEDLSGNGYDGSTDCEAAEDGSGIVLKPGCAVETPLESKGRDYTLMVKALRARGSVGTLLTGKDSMLEIGAESVTLISGGEPYRLGVTVPEEQWSTIRLIGRRTQTFLKVDEGEEREVRTVMGVIGERLQEGEIAIEAPIAKIGGSSFEGLVGAFELTDGA